MKYEISLGPSGKYVVCRVNEPVTTEFALEFGKATAEFSTKHDVNRQLYDVRGVRNTENISKNYDFAYRDMSQLKLQHGNRSAILVDAADRTHDFVQLVLRNAGYNVRIFIDPNAAIGWLEEPS